MWTTTLALLTLGQVGPVDNPASAVRAAHKDLSRFPPDLRYYIRYLSLHNATDAEKEAWRPILNGHVNQLSRSSLITRLQPVPGGLLRLNLKDYEWKANVWNVLSDPYFCIPDYHWKKFDDGLYWRVRKTLPAPWLFEKPGDKEIVDDLYQWTGGYVAVVRADWFFNQTAAQKDRVPGFYDFIGIKTEQDAYKVIGFDEKLAKGFRFELRDAVALSGVTLQPRAIVRWDSLGGATWKSIDFRLAAGERNPLKVLGRDIEKDHDASEGYGHLPNGFWLTWAADGKGKLVDAVPGDIANDHASRSNDKQIHPNIGCYRCHGPDAGLQPIDTFFRNLLHPPLELRTKDYDKAVELRQQYLRELKHFLDRDRMVFEAAVKEATGLTAKDYAAKYSAFWERYEDAKVNAAWAAKDLGMKEEELRGRLLEAIKSGYEIDPVVSLFVHKGERARAIAIRQWEEAVPYAYAVIHGRPMKREEK